MLYSLMRERKNDGLLIFLFKALLFFSEFFQLFFNFSQLFLMGYYFPLTLF